MAFKSKKDLDARREFIENADQDEIKPVSPWGFSDLKKMDEHQLADRLESITKQSLLMTWVICMHIRDRFKSDREMGQFINNIRRDDPTHPLCVSQSTINRYIHAGRFITKHKIDDLKKLGIEPTGIYALSAPANADVATKVFREVKQKGYRVEESEEGFVVKEIQRRIAKARAVLHVDEQPEQLQQPEVMDYDRPPTDLRVVPVVDGVAQEDPFTPEAWNTAQRGDVKPPIMSLVVNAPERDVSNSEMEVQEDLDVAVMETPQYNRRATDHPGRFSTGMDRVPLDQMGSKYDLHTKLSDIDDADLLLEMASRDASSLSDEQAMADLLIFAERYKKSYMKLIPIFTGAAQQLKTQMLKK